MKSHKLFMLGLLLTAVSCQAIQKTTSVLSNSTQVNGIPNSSAPASGTYFIVNNQHLALTPLDAGPGQNVLLRPFNKSGMQKWALTRSGNAQSPSYTIRLDGEVDGLWLQGYPVKDHTPIIGPASQPFSFTLTPVAGTTDSWYIKSNHYGGDAMHSFVFSTELPTEIRFDPAQNSPKYTWKLQRASE